MPCHIISYQCALKFLLWKSQLLKCTFHFRPQLDFSQFEEQSINAEIKLNEEEVTAASYVKNQFYVLHEGCLKELFTHIKPEKCPVCHSKSIRMDVKVVRTSVILRWVSSYLKTLLITKIYFIFTHQMNWCQ